MAQAPKEDDYSPVFLQIEKVCVGDSIELTDKRVGTVEFIGPTSFSGGVWYGIRLDHPLGRHNGTWKGHRYFDCLDKHGIFISLDKISRIKDSAIKDVLKRFEIDDIVECIDYGFGRIKFIGPTLFSYSVKNKLRSLIF